MFGIFRKIPFDDPVLGRFTRSRGYWRNRIRLDDAEAPLVLAGTRQQPDVAAVEVARKLPSRFSAMKPAIAGALFEHAEPYLEDLADSNSGEDMLRELDLRSPADVWRQVELEYVLIGPLDKLLTTEFGYSARWDEEHTLGVRFHNEVLLGLCGSVLAP